MKLTESLKSELEMGILYKRWGDSGQLEYAPLPPGISIKPESVILKLTELLIRVRAISINPVDWKILSGSQRMVTSGKFPRIFGSDFSGEIYKVGKSAKKLGFFPGDRVLGMVSPLNNGSGRQWLTVKMGHCIKIPKTMSFQEAASLPAAGISAILATNFSKKRQAGKVLVIGAGGGVGSLAVQILAHQGWDICAVCRPEQQQLMEKLGCRTFFDRQSWKEEMKLDNGKDSPTGIWDAILDSPAALIKNNPAKYLRRGACYSPVFIPDPFIPAQITRIILWAASSYSTGLFLAYPSKSRMKALETMLENDIIQPVIDSVWKPEECNKAVLKSMRGGITGKLIINLDQ